MKRYRIFETRQDYKGSRAVRDEIMVWSELQALLGKTLLEFESAAMNTEGDGYYFKGRYQAAGGQMETHGCAITWENAD